MDGYSVDEQGGLGAGGAPVMTEPGPVASGRHLKSVNQTTASES